MKFLYHTVLGALTVISFNFMLGSLQKVLSVENSIFSDLIISLGVLLLFIGSFVYIKPDRSWMYGVSISYSYYWLSLLLFSRESLIVGLERAPIIAILVSPIPLVLVGLLGVWLGRSLAR